MFETDMTSGQEDEKANGSNESSIDNGAAPLKTHFLYARLIAMTFFLDNIENYADKCARRSHHLSVADRPAYQIVHLKRIFVY